MNRPRTEHWDELEHLIGQAIECVSEELPQENFVQIREFNEHREYGLALLDLVDIYCEGKTRPSDEVRSMLTRIASEMNMEAEVSKLP
jgi:hypothetical protein